MTDMTGSANHVSLSPLTFLRHAAETYPGKVAVIHGPMRRTYADFFSRCRRLASALARQGLGAGDTVAVLLPNGPEMLEAHYGIPAAGCVLNTINTRVDAAGLASILRHGEARLLIADREWGEVVRDALSRLDAAPPIVEVVDPSAADLPRLADTAYEAWLAAADPAFPWHLPADEHDPIALNYTSGTVGDPKGVLYGHRGSYLSALGNALTFGLSPRAAYLWTLPMFHCNGWSFPWAVTAVGATHVCLRKVDPAAIFQAIAEHGVTHLCGAPVVLGMLARAAQADGHRTPHPVEIATGGAAPPSAIIEAVEAAGFRVTHLYGLTETHGPSLFCPAQDGWEALDLAERARLMARQGVPPVHVEEAMVADPVTLRELPRDGTSLGEIMLRGNTVMRGYLRNPAATEAVFTGGWFHTGDLGVRHPDGTIEVKDRSKDIIISGGENISSLEVEDILHRHPAVLEAAVVAHPDETWGETPLAFVALREEGAATAEDLIAWCRANMARYKVPRGVLFGPLPRTSTGKVQKNLLRDRARVS
ncbi:AMP-binding protein [Muricoccus radiodurans]|uniref:AMP-binding protein n=1 Tax=Muricoccus radiodurans TaxID=2231721 RepID=UPI003CFA106C